MRRKDECVKVSENDVVESVGILYNEWCQFEFVCLNKGLDCDE